MRNKPRVLLDIKSRKSFDSFTKIDKRVNLSFVREKLPKFRLIKPVASFSALLISLYFAGYAIAPNITANTFAETLSPQEEQKVLKEQLQAYEAEIVDLENKITEYNKKGATLKGEISMLNNKISKVNLQIKAVNLSLTKLSQELAETNTQINQTESSISNNKSNLTETLESIYLADKNDTLKILLKSKKLSDFFDNVNNLNVLQENLRESLEGLIVARNELVEEKEQLDLQKADAQALKAYQDAQKAIIQKSKEEKDSLLKVTKGQESKFKDLVVEKKKAAAEIRNRIFRLLGGGELRFEEAVKIAQVAEKAIGVRSALILSVLTQESGVDGVIGKNLGRCYYNTPKKNASGTVMSDKQKPAFLAIIAELGGDYKPETTPVSCPIVSDGQYGGAIGPAQFMPVTWMLYRDRVSKITGGKPANPFNNLDAFTATALYLDDGLEPCKDRYQGLFYQEACAAAKYYAGGNWSKYMSRGRYGYRVAERAADLQKDIDTLAQAGQADTF